MGFEEAYQGWTESRLTQEDAAQLLGVCAQTFRRCIDRCLWLALAAPGFAATAVADDGSTTDAEAPGRSSSEDTTALETFVRAVGIDMATGLDEVRRVWARATKPGINECGIPGTHGGHSHGEQKTALLMKPFVLKHQ